MKVSVSRTINCAHHLPGTELHGHSYKITATVQGSVQETGFACTFESLKEGIRSICDAFDHKRLELFLGSPATAENLAIGIARAASKAMDRIVNIYIEVGDDGSVETNIMQRDGDYFDRGTYTGI